MKTKKAFLILSMAIGCGINLQAMDHNFPRVAVENDPTDMVAMTTSNMGGLLNQDPMDAAVRGGNLDKVKSLIAQSQDKNWRIKQALFAAGRDGKQEVVMFLLSSYPFAASSLGLSTLLASAAGNGHLDLVKLALEKGANIEGTGDEVSTTPLQRAVVGGRPQIAKYLIEQGANTNVRSSASQSSLLRLIAMGDYYATMRVILTTIPLREAQRIKAAVASIRFGTPFPRDIRNVLTLKLIRQFVQEHMVYAQRLLDDVEGKDNYVPWGMKRAIADLREPVQWNAIRQEVETNFRQILARPLQRIGAPQLTREQQEAVNAFLKSIEGSGEQKPADTDKETDYDELYE